MRAYEIIDKKRRKKALTYDEIAFMVNGYVDGTIPDYQMSALLMAISFNGMNEDETFFLTDVMLNSGDRLDLTDVGCVTVDKHSTGGVGDKTTLILGPMVASTGLGVAKMSGRGLGHTGGTIDKLEAIPGFITGLDTNTFLKQVKDIQIAVASQTGNLVPADKKMYALRDVTATVESLPLIASSIMSKKIASGADHIVIDVKVGNGALMKTKEDALALAHIMIDIGKKYQRGVVCVLTNMEEPLGKKIGNALEVEESIDVLCNRGPKDVTNLCCVLASYMVMLGKGISYDEAYLEVKTHLENGDAYRKFLELVKVQHGSLKDMKCSDKKYEVKSKTRGYIHHVDALRLGELVRNLGAGRFEKDDLIDFSVGVELQKKVGDFVEKGDVLFVVYEQDKHVEESDWLSIFEIKEEKCVAQDLILDVVCS